MKTYGKKAAEIDGLKLYEVVKFQNSFNFDIECPLCFQMCTFPKYFILSPLFMKNLFNLILLKEIHSNIFLFVCVISFFKYKAYIMIMLPCSDFSLESYYNAMNQWFIHIYQIKLPPFIIHLCFITPFSVVFKMSVLYMTALYLGLDDTCSIPFMENFIILNTMVGEFYVDQLLFRRVQLIENV